MRETRCIKMPGGFKLDVHMTQAFIERIQQYYGLSNDSELSDDCIKRYIIEAMKVALDGAEHENKCTY